MMPLRIRFMRGAVALNHEAGIPAKEVRDVIAKLMLSPEFETEQPCGYEEAPTAMLLLSFVAFGVRAPVHAVL